ncbi:hypothetical protein BH09PLA1_BH09PLA1_03930 [soil metagenome]
MSGFINLIVAILAALLSAEPTTQPEWREKFDAVYGLAPDQILKHIQPPFIDERMEFYADAVPDVAASMPGAPTSITVRWDGSPHIDHFRFSGDGSGIQLRKLVSVFTTLRSFELEIAPELTTTAIGGDWVFRRGEEPAKMLEAIVAQFNKEADQEIVLSQHVVEEDVVVVKGDIRFDPNDSQVRLQLPLDSIELRRSFSGTGPRGMFLNQLSDATGYPVLDEGSANQLGWVEWGAEGGPPSAELKRISSDDLDVLLKAISEQTGLKFTIEPRKITRWKLFVSK